MSAGRPLDQALAHYAAGRSQRALDILVTIPGVTRTPAGCHLIAGLLIDLGRCDEALPHLAAARTLAPGDAGLHSTTGRAYQGLGRFAEAHAAFERALAAGRSAERLRDRGWARHKLGRFAEAIADFDAALALDPDDADAETCRGLSRLICGDYPGGLADYEARYRRRHFPVTVPAGCAAPLWRGEAVAGKRVLVFAEQGLGDAIQFARMARPLAALGAAVTLAVPRRLLRLLAPLAGDGVVVRDLADVGDADLAVPLLSLPHRLGVTLATIPWSGPYLRAEPERVARWRQHLGDDRRRRVGVVWQGNPAGAIDVGRSPPLASLEPLARQVGIRLIALQKTHGLAQLDGLPAGMAVETLGGAFDSGPDGFLDTAALMTLCDAVVSGDTAVAHLAGALGLPAYVLLQSVPDWRWGSRAAATPWYPSLRLIRQETPGDWRGVGARLAALLAQG